MSLLVKGTAQKFWCADRATKQPLALFAWFVGRQGEHPTCKDRVMKRCLGRDVNDLHVVGQAGAGAIQRFLLAMITAQKFSP